MRIDYEITELDEVIIKVRNRSGQQVTAVMRSPKVEVDGNAYLEISRWSMVKALITCNHPDFEFVVEEDCIFDDVESLL